MLTLRLKGERFFIIKAFGYQEKVRESVLVCRAYER